MPSVAARIAILGAAISSASFVVAQEAAFLGYQVGEERRYALGPPAELFPGEEGRWSIHLRELLGEPADGVFVLSHEWRRGDTGPTELPIGTITRIKSEGELRVNGHGFPVEVWFRTERHLAGFGDEIYRIDYRYGDGRYRKQISANGTDVAYTVTTRGHEHLDRSVPAGLYAFVPTAVDCSDPGATDMRQLSAVRVPRRSAGAPPGPASPTTPTRYADNRWCRESLFANPGLVTFMMPALREEGTGERTFLLLTPTGATGMPGMTIGLAAGGVRGGVGPGGAGSGSDFGSASRPDANSVVERLRYLERAPVQIGSRTRDVWVFDRMGEYEAIYVDDDDVVVRVDIGDSRARAFSSAGTIGTRTGGVGSTPIGLDPTRLRTRDLHVRLLFPSEY